MEKNEMKPSVKADLDDGDDGDFAFAMELVNASVLPMAMRTAIKLGVFEIMNKASITIGGDGDSVKFLSSSQIASLLQTKNPEAPIMLERLLRILASYSVLKCSVVETPEENGSDQVQRVCYGLTPACRYFVKNEDGVSLSPYLIYAQDKISLDCWNQLDDAILEGGVSFEKAHGMDLRQFCAKDSKLNELFNGAMSSHTTIVMKKILEKYKGFESLKIMVDVGGGIGANASLLVSNYPTIKGINFDLPHVIRSAPSYPGVEHVEGDMFESIPKGDAIFMKWVLHNWSDESCLTLLKNCYKALPEEGKVIVVEAILPAFPHSNNSTRVVHQMDLIMMAKLPRARERTLKEFEALAIGSGFAGIKLVCKACGYWIIEFYIKKMK